MESIEDKIVSNVATGSATVQTDRVILKQEYEQPFIERHRDIIVGLTTWMTPRKYELNIEQYENLKFRRDKRSCLGDTAVTEAITIDPLFIDEFIEVLKYFKKRYLELESAKQGEQNAKSNN